MGIFGPKRPLSIDEWEWQLASFKWLIEEFGGIKENPTNQLVIPSADFFPPTSADPSQKAQQIFDQVKILAGMEDWPTRLNAGDETRPAAVAPGFGLKHDTHAPAGEYRLVENAEGGNIAEIFYNPSHINQPEQLIATFAHELAHYLMSGAKTPPPGGWKIHELTTDLAAVYLGFGTFLANSASNFSAFTEFDQMGWQHERQGYLSEHAFVCAIAIWETLAGRDVLLATPFLKPHLAKDLKAAVKYVQKQGILDQVMAMDLDDFIDDTPETEATIEGSSA